MNKFARSLGLVVFTGLLASTSVGCLKKMLLDATIASTRKASAAVSTISDYEIAKTIAQNALATNEGHHYLAPDNEDALFNLTKGWAGVAFGFIEDEMEQAEDEYGDMSEQYEYHRARGVAAYSRAIYYGIKLIEMHHEGFQEATHNTATMRAYMEKFKDPVVDAPNLFWLAQAWLARTGLLKDDPPTVAQLYIGYELIRRSVELDETYNYGSGRTILGAYHARSTMAELDEAKKQLDRALEISGGGTLLTKVQLASRYYCAKVDKENYVRLLTEVIEAGDVLPEQRLQNTIAKRRASRYLQPERMEGCGFH